jgi:hypothetical protein
MYSHRILSNNIKPHWAVNVNLQNRMRMTMKKVDKDDTNYRAVNPAILIFVLLDCKKFETMLLTCTVYT